MIVDQTEHKYFLKKKSHFIIIFEVAILIGLKITPALSLVDF
jgi:hypothetical protein